MSELLGRPVATVSVVAGAEAERAANALRPGDVLLLENTRFEPGEEANDAEFAASLARLGDLFVNDAFGAAHRAHASTVGVANLLPAYAGLLLQREVKRCSRGSWTVRSGRSSRSRRGESLRQVRRLEHLLGRVDALLLGGGMANTVLLAQGYRNRLVARRARPGRRGPRLIERPRSEGALACPATSSSPSRSTAPGRRSRRSTRTSRPGDLRYRTRNRRPLLPADRRCANRLLERSDGRVRAGAVRERHARHRPLRGRRQAYTVVGGGDSLAAIEAAGVAERIDHISTGGGASLEYLEGRVLPGIAAIPTEER